MKHKKAKKVKATKPKKEKAMQQAEQTHDLNEGAETDPVFKDDIEDTTGLDEDVAEIEKTPIPAATNLFQDAEREHKRRSKEKEADVKIGLLIGAKNLVKLRAFGYDVVETAPSVPGDTHMGIAT